MQLLRVLSSNPRWVFLLDGCGALLTAALLLFLLVPFERHVGMPVEVLTPLACVAFALALYSFGCCAAFTWIGPRYRTFLAAIAFANCVYCMATLAMVVVHRAQVTSLGVAYFVGESVVVALVVALELKTALRPRDPIDQ